MRAAYGMPPEMSGFHGPGLRADLPPQAFANHIGKMILPPPFPGLEMPSMFLTLHTISLASHRPWNFKKVVLACWVCFILFYKPAIEAYPGKAPEYE